MNDQLKSILEQQLRDAQVPDAVSWWPLAIGWWVLIALFVIGLTLTTKAIYKRHYRNVYRKIAVKELDYHFTIWQNHAENGAYLQAANTILKRSCSHFGDDAISLSGKQWLTHLNAHSKTDFSAAVEVALMQQLYQESPETDISSVHAELKTWLTEHSAERHQRYSLTLESNHA